MRFCADFLSALLLDVRIRGCKAFSIASADEKENIIMKICKIFPAVIAAVLVLSATGCEKIKGIFSSDEAEETTTVTFDESGYESRIAELESQEQSLKAETLPNIGYKDKMGFILGKDNPAVSDAAAAKAEAMADLPKFINIKGTEYSTALTTLTLNNMELTDDDVKDLKYMVNLKELYVYQNNITDISFVKGLTDLETLSLFNNHVSDLSPLAGLVSLKGLYLRSNRISDISALDGLYALEVLDLSENSVSDITPLAELRNINLLRLNDNNVSDISALSGMKKMDRLHLHNNSISDIAPLSGMADLTEVYLDNNNVTDIEPLMSLTSLGWIRLDGNHVTNLTPLKNLIGLKKVYLVGVDISDDELQSLRDRLPDTVIVTK